MSQDLKRPSEEQVRTLIRQVLERLSATRKAPAQAVSAQSTSPRIVDASDIQTLQRGSRLQLPIGTLITPLAYDAARERRIELELTPAAATDVTDTIAENAVAFAADHGGFRLKELLKPFVEEMGYTAIDVGTHSPDSVDYPDYAYAAAQLVSQGKCQAAIVIDGAGIGSCMAANKVPGVRASMCYDVSTASNAREHNYANVLTLGAGLIGDSAARQIVKTWLSTPWGAERHGHRVDKIMAIEKRFLKA